MPSHLGVFLYWKYASRTFDAIVEMVGKLTIGNLFCGGTRGLCTHWPGQQSYEIVASHFGLARRL